MNLQTVVQRFRDPPPRNVGGGDLVTRVFALLVLAVLAGMIAPLAQVPFPLLKISLLIAAEFGLMSLMLGLFLRSKTYFAGIQLFAGGMAMFWLASGQSRWPAVAVGVVFVGTGVVSVVTRRSRLNAALGISSLHVPLEEVEGPSALNPSLAPGLK